MHVMKSVVVVLGLSIQFSLMAEKAPEDMNQFNVICPAAKLVPVLDTAYHECNNGFVKKDGSCEKFVEIFKQLMPTFDCQRSFDKGYIVPAIWLAGDGAALDYVRLIWRLASTKEKLFRNPSFAKPVSDAKSVFASQEFRAILDGETAEEYRDLSKSMERRLAKPH